MATEAQMRANARNAQRSTGPQTDEGKAASAQNALRHGMRAADVLLPEEDAAPLAELHEQLFRDLRPQGTMENLLFDRVVAAAWRLRRARLVECGLFERSDTGSEYGDRSTTLTQQLRLKFQAACQRADALGKLARYEGAIERSLHRALAELRRLQETREDTSAETILPNEPNSFVSVEDTGNSAAD